LNQNEISLKTDKIQYFSNEDALNAPEFLAQSYVYINETFQPVPLLNIDTVSGAGSVASNVLDYALWLKAMINSSGPISPAGHAALKASRTIVSDDSPPFTGALTYALGWARGVYHGEEWIFHNGEIEGYLTDLIFFPRLKYGLVAFGNAAGFTTFWTEQSLFYKLIDDKLGVPESKRFDWDK